MHSRTKKTHPGAKPGWVIAAHCDLAAVGAFAVRGNVETFALVFFADAQTDGPVNQLVGNQRHHARPDNGQQHGLELDPDLVHHRRR